MRGLSGVLLGQFAAQGFTTGTVGAAQRGKEGGLGGHRDITVQEEDGTVGFDGKSLPWQMLGIVGGAGTRPIVGILQLLTHCGGPF